jgi:hypothetical protein
MKSLWGGVTGGFGRKSAGGAMVSAGLMIHIMTTL